MMNLKQLSELCLLLSVAGFVYMDDVRLRPLSATVSDNDDGPVYSINFEGTTATYVLWEDRRGPLVSYEEKQMTGSAWSSSLNLPELNSNVHVILAESERNMNGYKFYFQRMSEESLLPGVQIDKSADVIHFPGAKLTWNVTVLNDDTPERRFGRAEFVGAFRDGTHSKIVHIPAFQSNLPLVHNEIGRVGKTIMYEVIPPDVEGLLILFASMSDSDYEERGILVSRRVVKNVPAGRQDLFEEPDSFFGVSLPEKLPLNWCACPSNIRCTIQCDALGANVDSIELYFENMTKAYSIRHDMRHENTYMKSEFLFDDTTKGEKGQLKCQATNGNGDVVEETCDMIIYEDAKITYVGVEQVLNENVFRCSATGFPRPVFRFFVDIDDDPFRLVTPRSEEPVDGVYSATYSWTSDHTVTAIRCQAVCEFTSDTRVYHVTN